MVFSAFEPGEFVAQGDRVVALEFYEAISTATGRTFASDWVMSFTLEDGKIVSLVEFTDSDGLNRAFASES